MVVDAAELGDTAGHGVDHAGADAAPGGDLDGLRGVGDKPLVHEPAASGRCEGDLAPGEAVGELGRVGCGPLVEAQRQCVVGRFRLARWWSRGVRRGPRGEQPAVSSEGAVQRSGHGAGRPALAVFDVPEVATVDVRVLGEAGKRQPGIGA